jgi:hypothetical protein
MGDFKSIRRDLIRLCRGYVVYGDDFDSLPPAFKSPCYIYIAESGKYSKVGVSRSPKERILTLQVGNPHPIKLYAVLGVERESTAYAIETKVHKGLAEYHVNGEWFWLRGNEALYEVLSVAMGVETSYVAEQIALER